MIYPEVWILGCGNPLFADDGFGPAVALEMQKLSLPNNIGVIDAGLGGPHYISHLDPELTKKLIIVCAADFGAEPGTIRRLKVEDLPPGEYRDAHSWDLAEPLQRIKDQIEVTIVGCQPKRVSAPEYEIGLSGEIQKAIPKAIRVILETIGVESNLKMDFAQNNIKPWDKGYKIVNRWEIIDIKKGGLGTVYIVHDHEWDRIVAIKTFQEKYLWDEDVIQRFMVEAETWTKLEKHTNIVFAIFVQRIEGKPLLFLEYIDSGDLDQFIGNLSIEESLDFAIQFCTGMEYAYQKLGVIHRDIKPSNVLAQKDPRFRFGYSFKITDFGLVKALGTEFQDRFVEISTGAGTLPFMPPEQFPDWIQKKFSFKGLVTTRSDIYSFGVTLYLLLTGKLPFYNMNEIFTTPSERPKNLNPEIPESLDILIIKCLEKNPDKRYTDFTELKVNLIKIFNDLTGDSYTVVGKKERLTDIDWSNKGLALDNLGKYREAIGCFDNALEINPRYDPAWNNKGLALGHIGNPQEAIECYNKALEINPRSDEAWSNKGLALGKLGNLQEAIECYDKALEINPRSDDVWNNKGLALSNLGNPQEAIGCYDKALEINPRSFEGWSNKGLALRNFGNPQEAIGCYDKALEINPRSDDVWSNKGGSLCELGNLQEAIECSDKALEINPINVEAWINKGNTLRNFGNPQKAIGCYDKALEINPRYAGAWFNKGNTLGNLGKHQEAIVCFDKALEINPRYVKGWFNKGNTLGNLGKHQEAIVCFDKVLEINPRNFNAWSNKGLALSNLGNPQEAIGCYDKALEINPRSDEAWFNKGVALGNLGKNQGAIECYDRTLDINPRSFEAWFNKGVALGNLGKNQDAIESYDRALDINPRYAEAWFNKGNTLGNLGKRQEAVESYDRSLEINPRYAEAWFNKGIALGNLGKNQDAIKCYEKFIELAPPQYPSLVEKAKQFINQLK